MKEKKLALIDEQKSPLFRTMSVFNDDEPARRAFDNNICAFHIGNGGVTRRSDFYKRLVPDDLKLYNRNSAIFKKKWKDMLPYDVRTKKGPVPFSQVNR